MTIEDVSLSATVQPDGRAVITLQTLSPQVWTVQQISPEFPTAPANSSGQIRKNGSLVAPFEPTGDAVGGEPSVRLALGDVLTIEWSNCTPGELARAFVIYDNGAA